MRVLSAPHPVRGTCDPKAPLLPVILRRDDDPPPENAYDSWFVVGTAENGASLAMGKRIPGLAVLLERAFVDRLDDWFKIARGLGRTPTAARAHCPSCAPNISDFGLMLAWTSLVDQHAAESARTLVVCNDPWLFRHLRVRPGVDAGRAPGLWRQRIKLALRGLAARFRVSAFMAMASLRCRNVRGENRPGATVLLVYGHPRSTAQGEDGYFGPLMAQLGHLRRMLHVDCSPARARALSLDGRTGSLHGWGSPAYALTLGWRHWRLGKEDCKDDVGWLVRRAAAREGGTGTGAMVAWQIHCQKRWLDAVRPGKIAWPYENHGWERALTRHAGDAGIVAIGYQHSVVGRQANLAPHSNPDGMAGIPGLIICNSASGMAQLNGMGIPADRMAVGGALRFSGLSQPLYDPRAPILVAAPFDGETGRQMVRACAAADSNGREFLVKVHPMTPFDFIETPSVRRTNIPFDRQPALSAVVFAATTVGLEGLLGGIPTIRFLPDGKISLDILPGDISVPVATRETLEQALADASQPPKLTPDDFFGPIDFELWRKRLSRE